MKSKFLLCLIIYTCCACVTSTRAHNNAYSKAEKLKTAFNKGNISMGSTAFEENKGQIGGYDGHAHPEVKFVFQQGNTRIFLLEKGIAYQFTRTHYPEGYTELMLKSEGSREPEKLRLMREQMRTETFRMDMKLMGANDNPQISAEGRSLDYIHYYNHDVLDVHQYDKITYHEIYPGIDWIIYARDGQVKYDFIVKPGADPSVINIQFEHQEGLSLNMDGSFTLSNVLGKIDENKPRSYQEEKNIFTKFILKNNIISFNLAPYDHNQNLVIDPALVWATYYGGISGDYGQSCATDASGNVYLAGATTSSLAIASGGHQNTSGGYTDAFLVKFNSSGIRQWATYYGGVGAEDNGFCSADPSGNIYLTGYTSSTVGIASGGHQNIHGGGQYDAFVVKFDGTGVRLWGTYYGGSKQDYGRFCSTDAFGNVYLAGLTQSSTGIAAGGHQNTIGGNPSDAFLVKFNGNGVRQWATYYGGAFQDEGTSCCSDIAGNIYLAGYTDSPSGIASGGFQNTQGDVFLAKFNSSGVRQWATYYSPYAWNFRLSCATDAAGNVFLAGTTSSVSAIGSGGYQNTYGGGANDAFIVKFDGNGIRLWASYYGGTGDDCVFSCATDAAGNVYLAGYSDSPFGIASGGIQNTLGGNYDAFLVMFNSSGSRIWATYYGSTAIDVGYSCVLDISGNIYLAGYSGSSSGIASAGHQNTFGGYYDAFLAKFCMQPNQPSAIAGDIFVCQNSSHIYSVNPDPSASSYIWSPPPGWSGSSSNNTLTILIGASGALVVSAMNACGASKSQFLNVVVDPCTSIDETNLQGYIIDIFPNPNAGSFEIRSATSVHITMYNETGQCVWINDEAMLNKTVTVKGLARGIYFVHLVSEFSSTVNKIIVVSE